MTNSKALRLTLARNLDRFMQATKGCDTQLHLAKRSGVAQSTIGRILRGETAATLDNLEALSHALGVGASDLLTSQPANISAQLQRSPDVAALPQEGQDRIAAFVQFTLNEYAQKNPDRFSLFTERKAPPEVQAQLDRAAARKPTENGNAKEEYSQLTRRPRGRPRKKAAA